VEAAWQTREQTIRLETIKPMVVVGMDKYPMQPEAVVSNRWETFVPLPADQSLLHYKFQFDFTRNGMPAPVEDSKVSQDYTLQVIDKPAGR
jgi:predicted membrane GTPase involved in stress response